MVKTMMTEIQLSECPDIDKHEVLFNYMDKIDALLDKASSVGIELVGESEDLKEINMFRSVVIKIRQAKRLIEEADMEFES